MNTDSHIKEEATGNSNVVYYRILPVYIWNQLVPMRLLNRFSCCMSFSPKQPFPLSLPSPVKPNGHWQR